MPTILQAPGKRLTKSYDVDKGRVVKRQYDGAQWFHSSTREVASVDDLAELQRWLQSRPDCCIIRGAPGRFHPGAGRPVQRRLYAAVELVDDNRRLQKPARKGSAALWQQQQIDAGRLWPVTVLPSFQEQPTNWLLLDFEKILAPAGMQWRDDLAYTAAYLRMQLPAEFHAGMCVYYATSSAADLTKLDLGGAEIRMRLGFVLQRGVTFAEAKRWLAGVDGLDQSTLRPAQPIYTAAPIFRGGLVDPMPERLGVLEGEHQLVAVPELMVEQKFLREAFTSLGPVRSAEGLGLLRPHPRLGAALARLDEAGGAAGSVRTGLIPAVYGYIADVGRDHVDIEALAEFLGEIAEQYREPGEVAGYGLEALIAWCLERAPEDAPARAHYPDAGLPVDEAVARLRAEMSAAVGAAVAWRAVTINGDQIDVNVPPVVGIKAGAGLGKTGEALAQIAAIPGVEQLNIEIYVPDHRLAEELATRARTMVAARRSSGVDLNPELRVLVIRGRGAADVDAEAMCGKAKLAEDVGKAGLNVMATLCRVTGEMGLVTEQCEFAGKCRYLAQFRENRPAIRIFPHASMFVQRGKDLPKPDLIVIDESFWRDAVSHRRMALDRLTEVQRWRSRPRKGERPFKAADRLLEAEDFSRRVRSAFEDSRDPRTVVTAEEASFVAGIEWGSRTGPGISPGMTHHSQVNAWQTWKRDECAKAGRFWGLLAEEHQHPDRLMQRIVLERDAPTPDGDRRHLLHLHHRRDLQLAAAPIILLDADLDQVIATKFFPAVRLVEIPVRQQAEIVQVVDRSCSMKFLLGGREGDQQRADNRLAEVQRFTSRILCDGGLFVSYKDALERVQLPASVDAVHLGNLRGRDGYKHHDLAVVAGRLEPGVCALERMARAMFGDEAKPLATVTPGDHGGTRYPTEQRRYRMSEGRAGQAVDVSVHPDPRAQALLEQVREREIEQAVARLRLVHRDRPATVYLLTNVPLNLEIATVATWNALVRDRDAEACARWDGLWLCSAGERAKAAPDLWPTVGAERQERRRKGCTESSILTSRAVRTPFPHYPGWGRGLAREAVTLVEYRYPGQRGSAHQALIPGELWCPDTARAYLAPMLGPVATITIVRTVHRTAIVDAGEPDPITTPFVGLHPSVMIPIDEAFTIAGRPAVRRTLGCGRIATVPMPEAMGWSHLLGLRRPPPAAAGAAS